MNSTEQVIVRHPRMEDGAAIWRLVDGTGVLDVNSSYCYLMMGKFFAETCAVAEENGKIVGFVTAFRPPSEPDSLFIWQIGVDASQRGKGLATKLLRQLLERDSAKDVRYLTATISPSNIASQKMFQRMAKDLNAELQIVEEEGMPESVFPQGGHESEPFYRIGPFRAL